MKTNKSTIMKKIFKILFPFLVLISSHWCSANSSDTLKESLRKEDPKELGLENPQTRTQAEPAVDKNLAPQNIWLMTTVLGFVVVFGVASFIVIKISKNKKKNSKEKKEDKSQNDLE